MLTSVSSQGRHALYGGREIGHQHGESAISDKGYTLALGMRDLGSDAYRNPLGKDKGKVTNTQARYAFCCRMWLEVFILGDHMHFSGKGCIAIVTAGGQTLRCGSTS